jgi:hypothetical protein
MSSGEPIRASHAVANSFKSTCLPALRASTTLMGTLVSPMARLARPGGQGDGITYWQGTALLEGYGEQVFPGLLCGRGPASVAELLQDGTCAGMPVTCMRAARAVPGGWKDGAMTQEDGFPGAWHCRRAIVWTGGLQPWAGLWRIGRGFRVGHLVRVPDGAWVT